MSMTAPTPSPVRWNDLSSDAPLPLMDRRRLIGEKVMVSRIILQPGFSVDQHAHDNEQITCVVRGRFRFYLGPERRAVEMIAGDALLLPSQCLHGGEAIEQTEILDIFSPPSLTTGVDQKR